MDTSELGRKIKEARLAKKMTQSELVGNFITRNMLSQIESGTAVPSVKTLEYLANMLELPLSYFMPGEHENAMEQLVSAKQALAAGNFIRVLELTQQFGTELEDERAALNARAYLELAKKEQDAQSALTYAKKASDAAENGIYANPAVKTEALLLFQKQAEQLSQRYKNLL